MRAMRNSAKWMMLMLGLAFVAWLVLEGIQESGMGAGGDPNPVVGRVGDRQIRYAEWNQYLQERLDLARQQREGGLTDEERRQITEAAWEQMVDDLLIRQEMERLGIRVTDAEIREAFRTSPPPDLMQHPAFQTDGRFDIEKYRQFFASGTVDRNLLLQIEAWYRETLPQQKLFTRVAEGVFVSDAELWQYWRDIRETARVRYVSLDPSEVVNEEDVRVSEAEVEAYYREHAEDFARPAAATVHIATVTLEPSEADSADARARAEELAAAIRNGDRTFEEAAGTLAAGTEAGAGEVEVRTPRELEPELAEAAFSAPTGQVAEPLHTASGYQVFQVERHWSRDSMALRQLVVPVEPSRQTEDAVFDLIDRLEGVALRSDLPTAADSVGVPIRRDVTVRQGAEFVPGVGALGVAVDWAFESENRPGDLSPFFEVADGFHVLELVNRQPAGTRPLEEVEGQIRERLRVEKRKEAAAARLGEALEASPADAPLEELAASHGWSVRTSEPFRRVDFVPELGQGTEAVGVAFGLERGERSGVVDAGNRVAVVEVLERAPPSREEFEERKEQLRAELTTQRRQEYVGRWLEALREEAQVQDMRDRIGQS